MPRNAQSLRIEPSTLLFGSPALPISSNIIAGSHANVVFGGVRGATISGGGAPGGSDPDISGENNNVVSDHYGAIGGGGFNTAGAENGNVADSPFATVGGGNRNRASGRLSTVSGGYDNWASGLHSSVAGGNDNDSTGEGSAIAGGSNNRATGTHGAIAGGLINQAAGVASTVGGGEDNCAGGDHSWAGGYRAKTRPATDPGLGYGCSNISYPGGEGDAHTFVWADGQTPDFISTGSNQFLVRANGGVALNTNTPRARVTIEGANLWNPTLGNGWGDFTVGTATHGLGIGVATGGAGAGTVRLWPRGGTEDIAFTTHGAPSVDILTIQSAGRICIRRSASTNALEVEGNASKTTSGSWLANSDRRIKTDIEALGSAVDTLLRLRPVRFRYTDAYRDAHPDIRDEWYYNVIAQEFAEVFPEAVRGSGETLPGLTKNPDSEILQVDFHPASVVNLAATQELALRMQHVEAENTRLRAELDALQAQVRKLSER